VKAAVLRPQAKQDLRNEIRYYRKRAGSKVADRLIDAIDAALEALQRQLAIGSPTLGQELGVEGLRTWDASGFPLVLIYIERVDFLDVVRILGQRQNIAALIRMISP
jgi:toxin ParE1/3/4